MKKFKKLTLLLVGGLLMVALLTGCVNKDEYKETLEEAEYALNNNTCDMFEFLYEYAVIEEMGPYIHPDVEQEIWFKWDNEKKGFLYKQQEIFKTTEAIFNKPYSKDKKGRSYLEYIEKNVGKDYYLEKGQYKENSLDLYESFDFNTQKKYYYLATLTKEQPLNEDALIYECNNGEEVTQIKKLLKTVYLGAIFLLSLILIAGNKLQKRSINKPIEEKATVIVKDSLNKISKDSLDVTRYFKKK